jgi:hypothetical protein
VSPRRTDALARLRLGDASTRAQLLAARALAAAYLPITGGGSIGGHRTRGACGSA